MTVIIKVNPIHIVQIGTFESSQKLRDTKKFMLGLEK